MIFLVYITCKFLFFLLPLDIPNARKSSLTIHLLLTSTLLFIQYTFYYVILLIVRRSKTIISLRESGAHLNRLSIVVKLIWKRSEMPHSLHPKFCFHSYTGHSRPSLKSIKSGSTSCSSLTSSSSSSSSSSS